jgi:hypothetical protein
MATASWQQAVWGKSNVRYVSFVVLGAVVMESVYGTATNFIWESANQGVRSLGVCMLCQCRRCSFLSVCGDAC